MKTQPRLFFCLTYLLLSKTVFAQYISNPSFEGQPGFSQIPPGWTICDMYSTPDTQPGVNGENGKATDGNTYLCMVGRDNPAPSAGFTEDCETRLLKPMKKDKCYKLKIDVAISKTMVTDDGWGDLYYYRTPMILKIYGESSSCAKTELFVKTAPIVDSVWQTLEFLIIPKNDAGFLYLKSDYAKDSIYFGNILIDNLRLTYETTDDMIRPDTTVNYGAAISLQATSGVNYTWTPNENLTCPNCQALTITPPYSTTYTVAVEGASTCKNHQEYFKVNVVPFIPNVITPNGDGKNDSFKILGLHPNSSLTIMNRMGEILFETENYDNSWGGQYKGSLLQPDTYWYILKSQSLSEQMTGFIYLKR